MNTTTVTFDDDTRHMILACKGHYDTPDNDRIEVLRSIYRYYYGLLNTSNEIIDKYIQAKLLRVIYDYGMVRNTDQFVDFVMGVKYGDPSMSLYYYESIYNEQTLYYETITLIANWKVHNRDDGMEYDLGEPDFEGEIDAAKTDLQ